MSNLSQLPAELIVNVLLRSNLYDLKSLIESNKRILAATQTNSVLMKRFRLANGFLTIVSDKYLTNIKNKFNPL